MAAGVMTATVTVTPIDDTAIEQTESVTLAIQNGTGYTRGTPNTATGSILDNDTPPAVSAVVVDATGSETASEPVVFGVTRRTAYTPIVVNLTWTGTAVFGTDYTVTVSSGATLSANGQQLTLARRRLERDADPRAGRRRAGRADRDGDDDDRLGHRLHARRTRRARAGSILDNDTPTVTVTTSDSIARRAEPRPGRLHDHPLRQHRGHRRRQPELGRHGDPRHRLHDLGDGRHALGQRHSS